VSSDRKLKIFLAALVGFAALTILVAALLSSGSGPGGPAVPTTEDRKAPKTVVQTAQDGTFTGGRYRSPRVEFTLPPESKRPQVSRLNDMEEILFTRKSTNARVRVQPALSRSLKEFEAIYAPEGKLTRTRIGGRAALIVQSVSGKWVSRLLIQVRGGRVLFIQTISPKKSHQEGMDTLLRVGRTAKLKG
jgi:hypothetical protein